jgi:putative nucleotidyltransferase with HDIG domain
MLLFLALGFVCYSASLSLSIPLFLILLGFYLWYQRRVDYKLLLSLGLLLALIVFIAYASIHYVIFPSFFIPVAAIGILVMLLYNDLHLALIMSFASSILVGFVLGNRFDLMIVYFTGSLVGAFSVKEARTRGQLINAGFMISVFQVLCIVLLDPYKEFLLGRNFLFHYFRPLFLNGFISAFIVMATLKIFEYLFGVVTSFSLLELSDFNHPLLKKMILEAPGTYHHSLFVGNLAEAAANTVGANTLLCRVGSYYHDIGKIDKPEYFTENQIFESNKHDDLEPTMSRLVIFNHVKNGVEMSKKYNLHPTIVDFIEGHHGKSLMHYFYQRAVAEAQEGEVVDEQTFRYPGPKPQTREVAIVMLADSVEGACRALEDPTPARIDELVRKIINNKFIDGQLDECTLTLKDLELIGMTFTRVLTAIYHTRVKYPEKKNGNTNRRPKSSEADASKSQPDYPSD